MEKKIIGIDLGGTSIKFAIISLEGEVQQKMVDSYQHFRRRKPHLWTTLSIQFVIV